MDINEWYANTLQDILRNGASETNKRTGKECASLPGLTFKCDMERDGFPLVGLRRIGHAFVAEQMWFLSGRDDLGWLSAHTRIWDAFAEADGTVTSAYGRRWRDWFVDRSTDGEGAERMGTVDQISELLAKLRADPTDRHGVVMAWDPEVDLRQRQKNVPCPVMFTVNVIGGRLNLHLVVRSNDMVLGFPTDAAGFAFLLLVLAKELGARPGVYTHSISNAHVYADHYAAAAEMVKRNDRNYIGQFFIDVPPEAYGRACRLEESLIKWMELEIGKGYRPAPPINGLTVAV